MCLWQAVRKHLNINCKHCCRELSSLTGGRASLSTKNCHSFGLASGQTLKASCDRFCPMKQLILQLFHDRSGCLAMPFLCLACATQQEDEPFSVFIDFEQCPIASPLGNPAVYSASWQFWGFDAVAAYLWRAGKAHTFHSASCFLQGYRRTDLCFKIAGSQSQRKLNRECLGMFSVFFQTI